jgi:hypothetical protein
MKLEDLATGAPPIPLALIGADVPLARQVQQRLADLNEDFERTGDATFVGLFGVNQHWGFDLPKADIRSASAGCLVGRTKKGHRDFMALLKADPRYEASHGYRFMTAVIPAAALAA